MADQIRFKDKQGKVVYIADSKGEVKQVTKDGTVKSIDQPKPIKKSTKG